ncbi:MAG: translesion DNA synthesis-associated protein ImuA [Pseudomonadales bacterium]|nr:translesion DNA synthesis-associated protein ImuA [Pseudomonadales bacterium]
MNTSTTPSLDQLIHSQPHLWRGRSRSSHHKIAVISTGFPQLDAALPDGGWPASGLMEWIVPHWGVGELRLLLPLLLHLNRQSRWCAWLSAPYMPYAPALVQQGFDLRYLLIVNRSTTAKTKQADQNLFWSMEKLLNNPNCGIVLAWPQRPSLHHLRRLQSAATTADHLAIVFQQQALANTPTPLRIRLTAETASTGKALNIEILKARGSLYRRSLRLVL